MMLTNTEGSHSSPLSIHLIDVGETPGQCIWGDFVAILVPELCCLRPCSRDLRSCVGCAMQMSAQRPLKQGRHVTRQPSKPVITQPMDGVMLKRCVMVDASRSLSCKGKCSGIGTRCARGLEATDGHFLLRYDNRGVLSPNRYGGMT